MKKKLVALILIFTSIISSAFASAYSATETGDVIFEKNADEVRPLASLTKLMNILVAVDMINHNKAHLDDLVTINYKEANMRESIIEVKKGDKIKLSTLLQAEIVHSANNAAYAVARYLGGSYDAYVEKMNEMAEKLDMKDTKFYSPAGLPTNYTGKPLDVSTAKDMYKLSVAVLKQKDIVKWAGMPYVEVNGKKYETRNKILGKSGNFGLKTGYHNKAKFNMVGVDKINGIDLIVITLGDNTLRERFSSQLKLADQFKGLFHTILEKDQPYGHIKVADSHEEYVSAKLEEPFVYYTKNVKIEEKVDNLKGTVEKGSKVGELIIYENHKLIDKINLIATSSTTELGFFSRLFNKFK